MVPACFSGKTINAETGVVEQHNASVARPQMGLSRYLGLFVFLFALALMLFGASSAQAQTDATVIATNAETAFGVIAPITITIAGFYVILKIAKKVVH